jgi:hypothetical protein
MDWKAGILFVASSFAAWLLWRPRVAYYFDAYMLLILRSLAILSAVIGLLALVGIVHITAGTGDNGIGVP